LKNEKEKFEKKFVKKFKLEGDNCYFLVACTMIVSFFLFLKTNL